MAEPIVLADHRSRPLSAMDGAMNAHLAGAAGRGRYGERHAITRHVHSNERAVDAARIERDLYLVSEVDWTVAARKNDKQVPR